MPRNRVIGAICVAAVLWPLSASAGDSFTLFDEDGERAYRVERDLPTSDSLSVFDSQTGRRVGVIEPGPLGESWELRDRNGVRRDFRDGPAQRWGSHEDRWSR